MANVQSQGLKVRRCDSEQAANAAVCEAQQKFFDLEPTTVAGYILVYATDHDGKINVELGGNGECKHDMLEALIVCLEHAKARFDAGSDV
jgi:hypothetical protein